MKQLRDTPLKRFLRDYRREHPVSEHHIALVLEDVEYPVNVGSVFRLADACGVDEIVLTGITATPPNPTLDKVARGKQRVVPWRYERDTRAAIGELREQGYTICALEITEESRPYHEAHYPSRICLVAGHEDHGVTAKTLALCDMAVFVPMYGKGRSLNVHVAVSVVCYHIRHTANVGRD
ncbi:MAG: RNA methyltransferase [Chloroflexi bacterium]|nr:RNA methyltransferase [Chloroflexota bacterium]MBU1746497.1 RNA methyltransferase [Chloroflexota bacterium]MBU1878506.1 RNA methyltransferase [Chloroflexota bacterium]